MAEPKDGALQKAGSGGALIAVTEEQKMVIKNTIAKDHTDAELSLLIYYCTTRGVHPLSNKIFSIKRQGKITFQTSIDHFRSMAYSTGQYDGQDEPVFEYKDNVLIKCTVKVWRKDIKRPGIGVARFKEFMPGPPNDFMWKKMPENQLAKCAEAQALRKHFPEELGDLYTDIEMQQADGGAFESVPKQSETVQPAQTKPDDVGDENVQDAEFTDVEPGDLEVVPEEVKLTAPQELHKVIGIHCGLDSAKMKDMLKEVSGFPDKPDGLKGFGDGQAKWRGNALKSARELIKKEENARASLPDSCTSDPTSCSCPVFSDGRALCGESSNATCPYGLGRAF